MLSNKSKTGKPAHIIRSLLVSSALTAVGMTHAQAETLNEALVAAYNSNPTLQAERAGLMATSENVRQAQAGWLPTVTLQGSVGTQDFTGKDDDPLTADVDSSTAPLSGAAVVSLPVFRGGQTYYGTKAAKAQTRAAEANLRSVEQQVLFDCVTAYYDVLRDISIVELSQNNVQVLERQLQAAQDRFRVGEITRTDVAQAEARLSGSRSRLTRSEAALIASQSAYERIVGHVPVNMGVIEDLPEIAAMPKSEEEAIDIALQSNPLLNAARAGSLFQRRRQSDTRWAPAASLLAGGIQLYR